MINPLPYPPHSDQTIDHTNQCSSAGASMHDQHLIPFLTGNHQLTVFTNPNLDSFTHTVNSQSGQFPNIGFMLPNLPSSTTKNGLLFPNNAPILPPMGLSFPPMLPNDEIMNSNKDSTDFASFMNIVKKSPTRTPTTVEEMTTNEAHDSNPTNHIADLISTSQIKPSPLQMDVGMRSTQSTSSSQHRTDEDYCDLCQKHFCNKYYLRKHKADVHGIHTLPYSHSRRKDVNRHNMLNNLTDKTQLDTHFNLLGRSESNKNNLDSRASLSEIVPISFENKDLGTNFQKSCSFLPPPPFLPLPISSQINKMEPMLAAQYYLLALANSYSNVKDGSELDGAKTAGTCGDSNKIPTHGVPNLANVGDVECEYCHKIFCNQYFLHVHKLTRHAGEPKENASLSTIDKPDPLTSSSSNEYWNFLKDQDGSISMKSLDAFKSSMVAAKLADRVTCNLCNKELCNKYFLRTHKIRVHGVSPDDVSTYPKRCNSMMSLSSNCAYPTNSTSYSTDSSKTDVSETAINKESTLDHMFTQSSSLKDFTDMLRLKNSSSEAHNRSQNNDVREEPTVNDQLFMNNMMSLPSFLPKHEWYNEATSVITCPLCSQTIGPRLFLLSHLIDQHGLNPMNPLFFLNILAAKPVFESKKEGVEEEEIGDVPLMADGKFVNNQIDKNGTDYQNKMPVLQPEQGEESPKSESTSPTELSISPSSTQTRGINSLLDQQTVSKFPFMNHSYPNFVEKRNTEPTSIHPDSQKEPISKESNKKYLDSKQSPENMEIDQLPDKERLQPLQQIESVSRNSLTYQQNSSNSNHDNNMYNEDIFNFTKSFQEASVLPLMQAAHLPNPLWYNPSCLANLKPLSATSTSQAVGLPRKSPNQMRVLCEICNKWICNKYFLRTHKANKHGITDLETGSLVGKQQSSRTSYQPNPHGLWTPPRGEKPTSQPNTSGTMMTQNLTTNSSPMSVDRMDCKAQTDQEATMLPNSDLLPLPLTFPPLPSAMYAAGMLPFMSAQQAFGQTGLFPPFLPANLFDKTPSNTVNHQFCPTTCADDVANNLSINERDQLTNTNLDDQLLTKSSKIPMNTKWPLNLCMKENPVEGKTSTQLKVNCFPFKQSSTINQQLASRFLYRARKWNQQRIRRNKINHQSTSNSSSVKLKRKKSLEKRLAPSAKKVPTGATYNFLVCPLCPTYKASPFSSLNLLLQHLALAHGCAQSMNQNYTDPINNIYFQTETIGKGMVDYINNQANNPIISRPNSSTPFPIDVSLKTGDGEET